MPRKGSRKNKGDGRGKPALEALTYHGPVRMPVMPARDDVVVALTQDKNMDWGSSVGECFMRCLFRGSSSGSFPSTISGNFSISAPDANSWSSFATEYTSYRVLALQTTVCTHLNSSTDGFGVDPLCSTVARHNSTLTHIQMVDSPEFQVHPVGTGQNQFKRDMRMLGVDEAEWVEVTNAYTAISPQPAIQVSFPDTPTPMRAYVLCVWTVQFRGRV